MKKIRIGVTFVLVFHVYVFCHQVGFVCSVYSVSCALGLKHTGFKVVLGVPKLD